QCLTMDYAIARANMIDSQIRPNGVTDRAVIAAMSQVPRELYLPPERRHLAYMDECTPIKDATGDTPARYLMEPRVFAKLLQLAEVTPRDLVLDIGSGTGYSAAVLATMAASVVAVERDDDLAHAASATLKEQQVTNVAVVQGVLSEGYPQVAPYDVIMLEGSVPEVPQRLLDQLADGGRLVAVIGAPPLGRARVYLRVGETISWRDDFDAAIAPLPDFVVKKPQFVF